VKVFFQIWCIAFGLAFIWPQVWRAVRHDTSHGISPFGLMHGLVGSSLWLTYGILQGDVAIWFANTSFIIAQSIIISVVYRHGKIPRVVLIRVAASLVALALLLTQVSATPVGFIAIAISGSSIIPQLIHVIRTENLHGISISSYLLTIVNCSSWLLYGFYVKDPMVSAQNFFAIPIFIYITAKAARWRSANPDYVAATA
jgi:MtN3 and saliva related transmembrane protein